MKMCDWLTLGSLCRDRPIVDFHVGGRVVAIVDVVVATTAVVVRYHRRRRSIPPPLPPLMSLSTSVHGQGRRRHQLRSAMVDKRAAWAVQALQGLRNQATYYIAGLTDVGAIDPVWSGASIKKSLHVYSLYVRGRVVTVSDVVVAVDIVVTPATATTTATTADVVVDPYGTGQIVDLYEREWIIGTSWSDPRWKTLRPLAPRRPLSRPSQQPGLPEARSLLRLSPRPPIPGPLPLRRQQFGGPERGQLSRQTSRWRGSSWRSSTVRNSLRRERFGRRRIKVGRISRPK